MASGRFVSRTIAEDKRLNELSIEAQLVYLMAIPHLDRDGLIAGDVPVLFGRVCPRRMELAGQMPDIIRQWLQIGLVVSYETDNGAILRFVGFAKNQQGLRYDRETPSQYEPPPGYISDGKTGLVPVVDQPTLNDSGVSPALSGVSPAEVEVKDQLEVEVKDQLEVEAQAVAPDALDDVMARLQPNEETHSDLPPKYDISVAEQLYSQTIGRVLKPGDKAKLSDMSDRATSDQIAEAMQKTLEAMRRGTHIHDGVAYAGTILKQSLQGESNNATHQQRSATNDGGTAPDAGTGAGIGAVRGENPLRPPGFDIYDAFVVNYWAERETAPV